MLVRENRAVDGGMMKSSKHSLRRKRYTIATLREGRGDSGKSMRGRGRKFKACSLGKETRRTATEGGGRKEYRK